MASFSVWPPERNVIPGTAAGTVRLKAVTVALAICSGVACSEHSFPGVTMFGFNKVPK